MSNPAYVGIIAGVFEHHEICQWCLQKFAVHWTFWTQEPNGRGQRYARTYCEKCWAAAGGKDALGKYELTREEWLLSDMMHE